MEGPHFPFEKLLGIGYWFYDYLIGEYRGVSKYYHSHVGEYLIENRHLSLPRDPFSS